MKNLMQLTTVLFLLVQAICFGQTDTIEASVNEKETIVTSTLETDKFKNFIGKYRLAEADIILEIIQEKDEVYLLSPGAKDPLTQKNETTLREPRRGVDLEIIEDNTDALKFTQNGYETTIKRVTAETQN